MGTHWGIETADRGSFISTTEGGWNNSQNILKELSNDTGGSCLFDVNMSESGHIIEASCEISERTIERIIELKTKRPSVFQDFVCRFRFDARQFPVGNIAGRRLEHRGTNVWHQFPVQEASVSGPIGTFHVQATEWETAGLFELQCYLRDEPTGLWILHLRMMPVREDLFWIRWQNRFGNFKVTDRPADWLLRNRRLRKALWYYAERHGGSPNIQAQPLAVADAGVRLAIRSITTFVPERGS
ncbi:hypothetical protein [Sphingomonas sp. IC081]|uniref:hypothetical protein n=1 Tax=Sphingomonas sp. IC081 TaxID=304378 RepID=UPI001158FF0B|nr:hypothetical protein [Sphingomonas sp. IC081]